MTVKNYVIVEEMMKALRMDTSVQEAQSRMSHLQDVYKILEAHNLAEEMFTEAPRRIIGYFLDALELVGFRDIIRHQLTMETNKDKNKHIVLQVGYEHAGSVMGPPFT
ncbi:DEAD-box ATP-dependent RNA helicase 36 [Phytophthora cinnamomi]|uniref:DEAD-box ATP-dependent RNA helicase 36 n=1 Tax=Phytophthora cinnamomi TaxID=4785 RepID=UPI003559547E|nr:DEAD-box ATP-dependent RNA helicase 36 [Phytophthora cinnamomi]